MQRWRIVSGDVYWPGLSRDVHMYWPGFLGDLDVHAKVENCLRGSGCVLARFVRASGCVSVRFVRGCVYVSARFLRGSGCVCKGGELSQGMCIGQVSQGI